jgi:hypothetical protein
MAEIVIIFTLNRHIFLLSYKDAKPVREHICVLYDVGVNQQPIPHDHGSGIGHDAKHMCLRAEPSLAAGKWTQVAGCCASVDVPLVSSNKDLIATVTWGNIAWPVPWVPPLVVPAWPTTVRLPLRCTRIAHLLLLVLVLNLVGVC